MDKNALQYWVGRLKKALGKPVPTMVLTKTGVMPMMGMPTPTEMAMALGMSEDEMRDRFARSNLKAWDVSLHYVGGDEQNFDFYSGPRDGVVVSAIDRLGN